MRKRYFLLGKIWSDNKTHNSQALWIEKLNKEYEALKKGARLHLRFLNML